MRCNENVFCCDTTILVFNLKKASVSRKNTSSDAMSFIIVLYRKTFALCVCSCRVIFSVCTPLSSIVYQVTGDKKFFLRERSSLSKIRAELSACRILIEWKKAPFFLFSKTLNAKNISKCTPVSFI